MSLSFSTLSATLLEIWSDILDIQEQLHTASIEFTVLRENRSVIGLEVGIRCLLAEQKETSKAKMKRIIDECEAEIKRLKGLTVTTNC